MNGLDGKPSKTIFFLLAVCSVIKIHNLNQNVIFQSFTLIRQNHINLMLLCQVKDTQRSKCINIRLLRVQLKQVMFVKSKYFI